MLLSFVCVLTGMFYASATFAAAGDSISTRATINYTYNGNTFVQESSPLGNSTVGVNNGADTVFIEDRLINFTVSSTDAAASVAASGQLAVVTAFTVTNFGNNAQDFLLTARDTSVNPFGLPADNIDVAPPLSVYVENNATPGYQATQDTAIFVDELVAGATATVYVLANLPVAAPGDVAAVTLIAQAAQGGAAGTEGLAINNDDNNNISPAGVYSNAGTTVNAGTPVNIADSNAENIVFNEPAGLSIEDIDSTGLVQDVARNGQHADSSAYEVQPAAVTINKTVTVIDTLGGTDPHAGATLRYQLDVVITGTNNINNLVITDTIPANTTYTPASITLNGIAQTDASDVVDFSEFTFPEVIVDLSQGGLVAVTPGTPNTIIFDVTID